MTSAAALLLAALLGSPGARPVSTPIPAPRTATRGEPLTLRLKDADLRATLELLAQLLGKTPILDPAISGTVTLDVVDAPVAEVVRTLERSARARIRIEGNVLRVTRDEPAPAPGVTAFDRALLADPGIARRPAGPLPAREATRFELRAVRDEREPRVLVVGDGAARSFTLPGCRGPILVASLGADPFDQRTRLAFFGPPAPGDPRLARVVVAEAPDGAPSPFPLEGCDGERRLVEGSRPGAAEAAFTAAPRGDDALFIRMELLEVGGGREETLTAPAVQVRAGDGWGVRTSWDPSERPTAETIVLSGVAFESGVEEVVLAVHASVTREIEAPSGERLLVRTAHGATSFPLRLGGPERWTLSSTWGRGKSALVLSIAAERVSRRRGASSGSSR